MKAKNHNCIHCGKPIVLVPSATERARRYGETPEYYRNLFNAHANCTLKYRESGATHLIPESVSSK